MSFGYSVKKRRLHPESILEDLIHRTISYIDYILWKDEKDLIRKFDYLSSSARHAREAVKAEGRSGLINYQDRQARKERLLGRLSLAA